MWGYIIKVWLTAVLGSTVLGYVCAWQVPDGEAAYLLGVTAMCSIPGLLVSILAVWVLREIHWPVYTRRIILSLMVLVLVGVSLAALTGDFRNDLLPFVGIYSGPAVAGIWIFRWPKPAPPLPRID